jgi:hypothetical protein
LFEADRNYLRRVHVLTYEHLVDDPAGVLQEIFEFLEVEPIPPSESIDGRANEKYFRRWNELKRDPRMRAYLDLVSLKYERRVRPYGYSLLRPNPTKPLPVWAGVSVPPNQPETSASRPHRLNKRNAAAAALGAAAIAGAAYLGSPGRNTHANPRPASARSRACQRASERLRDTSCGGHQRAKTQPERTPPPAPGT